VEVLAAEMVVLVVLHVVFPQKVMELALSRLSALQKDSLLTEIVIGGDVVLKDAVRVFQGRHSCNTTTFTLLI